MGSCGGGECPRIKIIAKLIGLERFSKFIIADFVIKKVIACTSEGLDLKTDTGHESQNSELITFELALSMAEESIDEI